MASTETRRELYREKKKKTSTGHHEWHSTEFHAGDFDGDLAGDFDGDLAGITARIRVRMNLTNLRFLH